MSAIKGRTKRRENRPTALLQARVVPEIYTEVHEAAKASGVSISLYMETLLRQQLTEHGKLPEYPELSRPQREELPIPAT